MAEAGALERNTVMAHRPTPTLSALTIAATPAAWERAGLEVEDDRCRLGTVPVTLAGAGAGRGIVGWSITGLDAPLPRGLPAAGPAPAPRPAGAGPTHPNGAAGIDHMVAVTHEFDATLETLQRAGLDLRRVREADDPPHLRRQAFFRLGGPILEVVEPRGRPDRPPPGALLWGLALVVGDLDHAASVMGAALGDPRDAVQPGRRIATVRKEAGLGLPVALITPRLAAPPTG
ncbi:MAG: VOC family protein [Solirubrobacterales bacterium]